METLAVSKELKDYTS